MARDYDYLFKLVFIGDGGVGKSSLFIRFAEDTWIHNAPRRDDLPFRIRTIKIDGKWIKLVIFDTDGRERFGRPGMTTAYYRGAMGVLLIYDVTDESSFENVSGWMRNIEENASPDVERIILGNKCDLVDRRQVSKERGEELARKYGIKFMETSALRNINVEDAFATLARNIVEKRQNLENVRDFHETPKKRPLFSGSNCVIL